MLDHATTNGSNDNAATPFDHYNTPNSPIMFPVGIRALSWQQRDGNHSPVGTHKALVRLAPDARSAHVLSVVSNSYNVVHNRELFGMVETTMQDELTSAQLHGVFVKDKVAYGGRNCYREYVFPGLAIDVGAKSKVAFRTIVQNGYGGSALRIIAGAIEFYCTNGMIRGEFEQTYRKHTSGLRIENLHNTIRRAIDTYVNGADEWQRWTKKPVQHEQAMELFRSLASSTALAERLSDQWLRERDDRGSNLWSVYSALTYYASHNDGAFAIRRGTAENEAAIMMSREQDVSKWVDSPEFRALAEA